jgi:hypothetical protein
VSQVEHDDRERSLNRQRTEKLLLLNFHRLRQGKRQRGLGWKNDVFVACECSATCARAAASERANASTFASASQSANQRAHRGSAAGEHSRALTFAFLGLRHCRSFDRLGGAMDID